MPSSTVTVVIGDNPPPRLDKALARDVPEAAHLSRSRIAKLLAAGAVTLGGKVVLDPKARVRTGDCFEITIEAAQDVDTLPEEIPLDVVYEDDHVAVVDKPAGMVVHPAPGSPTGTLVNALLHHFGASLSGIGGERRPGIVHRIDKDTSGLLVVAKSDQAHHSLAAQFAAHSVDRIYTALCYGAPGTADPRIRGLRGISVEAGDLIKVTTGLDRHKADRQKQAVVFQSGRHAVTRFRVVETFAGQLARLDCKLETGRTHQIRVHAAYIGHGLIGDPVYGGARKLSSKMLADDIVTHVKSFSRQALHARTLGFSHPVTSERLMFESALPNDMRALLTALTE